MASTTRTALTADAYVALASGSASVMVQHILGAGVRIHVGTALPAAESDDYVVIGLGEDLSRNISLASLAETDNVYARAGTSEGSVVVTIKS